MRGSNESSSPTNGQSEGPDASWRVILDPRAIERALSRIAHEIRERNPDLEKVVLVAIREGGVPVGELLASGVPGTIYI